MAVNPEADLANWLQIFGPGRVQHESRMKKLEEIIVSEEVTESKVRFDQIKIPIIYA